jgi:hypothetical protein
VTTPRSQRWLESGALRRHRASRQEVADLLDVVERDLGDARATVISLDRRFATAYSAALQLATVVLAASGYRAVAQRGHHAVTLQALPAIIGDVVRDVAVYLDSCRSLRNRGDYDRVGVVSASDVTELLDETASFRQQVLGWLSETHPELLADDRASCVTGCRIRAAEHPGECA